MKARYIGKNKITGYKKGEVYDLVENPKDRVRYEECYKIIERKRGGGWNTYHSKEYFEKDWDVIGE